MTWLRDVPDADTDWGRLAVLCPEPMDALAGLLRAAWQEADPVLLELARLRIAGLLRNESELGRRTIAAREARLTDEKATAVASWPTSPLFDSRERACLALAEQFALDANGVTDELVGAVIDELGAAGCYAFVESLSVIETFQRACLTLGVASGAGVDDLNGRTTT